MVAIPSNPSASDPKPADAVASGAPEAVAEKVKREPRKKRKDFPDWKGFCAYQAEFYRERKDNYAKKEQSWVDKSSKGEGADKAIKALKKVEKLTTALEGMHAQLAALGISFDDIKALAAKAKAAQAAAGSKPS